MSLASGFWNGTIQLVVNPLHLILGGCVLMIDIATSIHHDHP